MPVMTSPVERARARALKHARVTQFISRMGFVSTEALVVAGWASSRPVAAQTLRRMHADGLLTRESLNAPHPMLIFRLTARGAAQATQPVRQCRQVGESDYTHHLAYAAAVAAGADFHDSQPGIALIRAAGTRWRVQSIPRGCSLAALEEARCAGAQDLQANIADRSVLLTRRASDCEALSTLLTGSPTSITTPLQLAVQLTERKPTCAKN